MSLPPDSPSEDANETVDNPRSTANTRSFEYDPVLNEGKLCKVCGDRAVGYNFGVISCESCKAFFRRNANRTNEIICPFKNRCEINQVSRRFCQSCRLQKCYDCGMVKEWAMQEVHKRNRKHKLAPSSPENQGSEEKELDIIGSSGEGDKVTVSKTALMELVRKAHEAEKNKKKTKCECTCQCGFYSKDTKLTAADSIVTKTETIYVSTASDTPTTSRQGPIVPVRPLPRATPLPPTSLVPIERTPSFQVQNMNFPPIMQLNSSSPNARLPSHQLMTQMYGHHSQNFDHMPQMQGLPYVNNPGSPMQSAMDFSWHPSPPGEYMQPFGQLQNLRPQSTFSIPPTPIANFLNMPFTQQVPTSPDPETINVDTDPQLSTMHASDRALLKELLDVSGVLRSPIDISPIVSTTLQTQPESLTLMDVVRISELALRRIIQHAKELSYFQKFSTQDQYCLIKGSVAELLILRGVMVFNKHEEEWKHLMRNGTSEMKIKLTILKQAFASSAHYEEHKKFMDNFDEQWRNNELVMLILNAITLFDPQRPEIQNKELVNETHKIYCDLLSRYLHTQCPHREAQAAFQSLCARLDDIPKLAHGLWQIYGNLDPHAVDPLLRELFDINVAEE
ncbi:hypothetical protein L596_005819 [Steinernema carpocapsae]|uniref:Nuclear receptor domain-containing protein n=1 Tax=Steinernema carpocapsae TaxID=34508 RepID=A0A4U8V097_STECR|nr:hypothetical protein L596_005819 [Steinernema carpocapsae]